MELLVKAENIINSDPEKDRRGGYKKGYPISVKPDGWAESGPYWNQSKYAQYLGTRFVIIKCPEVTVEQAKNYINDWRKVIDYEVLSSTPANGNYQIRVFGENISVTGQNSLTQAQVENFLLNWGCTIDGFAANEVTFTLRLWQSLQSEGFWERDTSLVGFTLVSYSEETGEAIVDINISGVLNLWDEDAIANSIRNIGGIIISYTEPIGRFSINRNTILTAFKRQVKNRVERVYCRRIYYLNSTYINTVIAAGGIITVTRNQLFNQINSKLDE